MAKKKDPAVIAAEEKFKYYMDKEAEVGEKGLFKDLVANLCEIKCVGHLWPQFAQYLSEIGNHEKARHIYELIIKDKLREEKECLKIVEEDPSKAEVAAKFYRKAKRWEDLAGFYKNIKSHGKAAEVYETKLNDMRKWEEEYYKYAVENNDQESRLIRHWENKGLWRKIRKYYGETDREEIEELIFKQRFLRSPGGRRRKSARAKRLCGKGKYKKAIKLYRRLGDYAGEAEAWSLSGKPGTAIDILENNEYINAKRCRRLECFYWIEVGLLANAAYAIERDNFLRAERLKKIEREFEEKVDGIVDIRLGGRIENLRKSGAIKEVGEIEGNKEMHEVLERSKVYEEYKKRPWSVKKVECLLRLENNDEGVDMMGKLGFELDVLNDYIERNGEFGKDNSKSTVIEEGFKIEKQSKLLTCVLFKNMKIICKWKSDSEGSIGGMSCLVFSDFE